MLHPKIRGARSLKPELGEHMVKLRVGKPVRLLLWRGIYRHGVSPAVPLRNVVVSPERLTVEVVQPGDPLLESGRSTRGTRIPDGDTVVDVDLADAGPAHTLVARQAKQNFDVVVERLSGATEELFGETTASGFSPPESADNAGARTMPESIYRVADEALVALTIVSTYAGASTVSAPVAITIVLADAGTTAYSAHVALTTVRAPPCIS
jgi:hypothetical protein